MICASIERDLARQLIIRALDGLGESDRFRTVLPSLDIDMDSLDKFINGLVIHLGDAHFILLDSSV